MAEFKTLLAGVVGAEPNRCDVRVFIAHCHRIAVAYLFQRIRKGRLQKRFVAGSIDQFALDCIADLFSRDDRGVFTQLAAYFRDFRSMDEQTLRAATRRLVFSQVNDALFRHYRERDPTLSRIIRALKRGIRDTPGITLIRHNGRLWVTTPGMPLGSCGNALPEAVLEHHLSSWLAASNRLTDLVRSLATYFQNTESFEPAYRLNDLSLAIRAAQTRLHVADPSEPIAWDSTEPPLYTKREIFTSIQEASKRVRSRLFETYVGQKVDARTFGVYLRTAGDVLASQYVDSELSGRTRLELLDRHLDGISPDEYRSRHRNILDYVIRETRSELLGILRQRNP